MDNGPREGGLTETHLKAPDFALTQWHLLLLLLLLNSELFQHPCPSLASGPSLTRTPPPHFLSPLPYLHQRLSSSMGKSHFLSTDFPEFPQASKILMSWCLDYWVCKCSLLVRTFLMGSSHFFFNFPFLFFDTERFPVSKHMTKDVSKACPLSRNLCVSSVLCVGNKQWV